MKRILLISFIMLLNCTCLLAADPFLPGDDVSSLKLSRIVNGKVKSLKVADLKGKLVILEFWTTWCGPCLPAMEHLSGLKRLFDNEIEVIAILGEDESKLNRYLNKHESLIWHIADPKLVFKQHFSFRVIPHTVVIDQSGRFLISTSPDQLSEATMLDLLKGDISSIQPKVDEQLTFDIQRDYFPPEPGVLTRFIIQPPMAGGVSSGRFYNGRDPNKPYIKRTFINQPLSEVLKTVLGFAQSRLFYEGIHANSLTEQLYCIDIMAPPLLYKSFVIDEFNKLNLDFKLRLEKREIEVMALIRAENYPLGLKVSESQERKNTPFFSNVTSYITETKSVTDFVQEYLNVFISPRINGKPQIIDETGIEGLYDFNFQLTPNDPQSLKEELLKLGLRLERKKKLMEVLVVTKS